MGLAIFRTILTLVVAVFLVCIAGANDFANPGASLDLNDGCDESVKPLSIWGSELCFTHGVTAALFALAAAAPLSISLIPLGDRTAHDPFEALHRLVSSVAAAGAGVYWLKDEAGETAWLHLAVVLFLGGIVIGSAAVPIAMLFPLNSLRVWFTRRIRSRRVTRLLVKRHIKRHGVFKRKLARLGMCLLILSLSGVVVVMVIWIMASITRGRSLLGKS